VPAMGDVGVGPVVELLGRPGGGEFDDEVGQTLLDPALRRVLTLGQRVTLVVAGEGADGVGTGVLLVAKRREIAARLGRTFQTRSAAKTYWALVCGVPKPPQGKIEAALVKAGGPDGERVRKAKPGEQDKAQHATTHYSVVDRAGQKLAWVSLKPVTGRQHQLRAHMALIGCPIVGDNKYMEDHPMPAENIARKLHLHARRLILPHPRGEGKIDVTAPLPTHMAESFDVLGFSEKRGAKGQRAGGEGE